MDTIKGLFLLEMFIAINMMAGHYDDEQGNTYKDSRRHRKMGSGGRFWFIVCRLSLDPPDCGKEILQFKEQNHTLSEANQMRVWALGPQVSWQVGMR